MTAYSMFGTDPVLEKNGVVIDYGDFRVTMARAGGSNKRFAKVLEARTKQYRRAIATETMDPEVALRLMRETYAETCVIKWEVRRDNKWVQGLDDPSGEIKPLPLNVKNVIKTFEDLPDLFDDLKDQAGKSALFRKAILEADAGN